VKENELGGVISRLSTLHSHMKRVIFRVGKVHLWGMAGTFQNLCGVQRETYTILRLDSIYLLYQYQIQCITPQYQLYIGRGQSKAWMTSATAPSRETKSLHLILKLAVSTCISPLPNHQPDLYPPAFSYHVTDYISISLC
jgi:hypothetical protein